MTLFKKRRGFKPKNKIIRSRASIKATKGSIRNFLVKVHGKPNVNLIVLVVLFLVAGLLMVFSASVYYGYTEFGDPFYYFVRQSIWIFVGGVLGYLVYFFPLKYLRRFSPLVLAFGIVLLLYILPEALFGKTFPDPQTGEILTSGLQMPLVDALNGAPRWINLQFFNLQPSEIVKFAFIVYIAAWLSKERKETKSKDKLQDHLKFVVLPFLILLGFVSGLILVQRDFDTTVILALAVLIVYYVSGSDRIHTYGSILIVLLAFVLGGVSLTLEPYRRERVETFWHIFTYGEPAAGDAQAGGFQVFNGLVGLGSGGLLGSGFGESVVKQGYLQEAAYTDSIFVVVGEEFGFLGVVLIIIGFLYFASLGLDIARNAPDKFAALLAVGMTSLICVQAFLNMAAVLALIPFGGMPLPFFTYGGSGTIMTLIAVGVLLNISKSK